MARQAPEGDGGALFASLAAAPLRSGLLAGLGAAVALLLAYAAVAASHALLVVVVAAFLAVGLDPAVRRLQARGLPRGVAVALVLVGVLLLVAGFVALAEPAVVRQARELGESVPRYLDELKQRQDAVGAAARSVGQGRGGGESSGLGVGRVVEVGSAAYGALTTALALAALTAYFLADLPRIKRAALRLVPRTRRARADELTEEILRRTGGYLVGQATAASICGVANGVFLAAIGVPSAAFLGVLTAVFDLVPIVGAPLAGAVSALVALTVSVPKAVATVAFVAGFRLLEDYLITPRIMKRAVEVDALTSIVAVLVGGAALGVPGALLAVPVAAAVSLVLDEVVLPALDGA